MSTTFSADTLAILKSIRTSRHGINIELNRIDNILRTNPPLTNTQFTLLLDLIVILKELSDGIDLLLSDKSLKKVEEIL